MFLLILIEYVSYHEASLLGDAPISKSHSILLFELVCVIDKISFYTIYIFLILLNLGLFKCPFHIPLRCLFIVPSKINSWVLTFLLFVFNNFFHGNCKFVTLLVAWSMIFLQNIVNIKSGLLTLLVYIIIWIYLCYQ